MNETQNEFSVSHGAPNMQIPASDHAMTLRFGIIWVLHIILGVACLIMLGFGFLLLETGDWFFFLSFGAASCAVGVAVSGLSAYFSARGGVGCSLLFALPALLVGVVGMIDVVSDQSSRVRLPLIVFFAFGVSMFVASYLGGLTGAAYGKKRQQSRRPSGEATSATLHLC